MPIIIFLAVACAAVLFILCIRGHKLVDLMTSDLFMIIAAGVLIRILAAYIPATHQTDIACFQGWADKLFADGLSGFYTSDGFHDYPPGYMYVLYAIGFIRSFFKIEYGSFTHVLLIKLPAILADVGTGVFLYIIARKHLKDKAAYAIAFLYILNPAVWLVSSVWGQVDSVHTITIAASVYFLTQRKTFPAFALYTVSFVIKPQAFMFAPLYLFYVWDYLKGEKFRLKAFGELAEDAVICVAGMLMLFIPFTKAFDFMPIIRQYADTLSSYPYASVNAYNFWGALGLNWAPISRTFLNVSYGSWGTFFIVLIVLLSFYMLNKKKSPSNYFFTAAIINILTFMFSVKMHERYAFPALALLLAAYAFDGNKRFKLIYTGFSVTLFINLVDVLRVGLMGFDWSLNKETSVYFSLLMLVTLVYTSFSALKTYGGAKAVRYVFEIDKTQAPAKYGAKDFLALGAVTLVYAVFAFVNLGNLHSPQTMWHATAGETLTIDLGRTQNIGRMQYFMGPREDRRFDIDISSDGINWENITGISENSVFKWEEARIDDAARFVRITALSGDFYMAEIAFRDAEDRLISAAAEGEVGLLLDEQQYVPDRSDYMNGTYFDEIYHPRTAYEFVHGLRVYENTHPPLGKVIISIGIRLFGMTPFGWRFSGALFGVLMLPLVYMFGKRLFGETLWASCATVLFAFDFMHFAQTRLATIDTYIVFFVIAMYYFMYVYYTMSFYSSKLWKTLVPLFLSGLFMGLGVASKWPGVYAGIGLAVLFFITIGKRYAEYRYAKRENLSAVYNNFYKYTAITLAACLVFFVAVPVLIYALSYIPFYYKTENFYFSRESFNFLTPFMAKLLPDNDFGNFICSVIQNQLNMFDYHANQFTPHPYSSVWWQWILDIRPIFYFAARQPETAIRQGISSFGSPLVWWGGLASLIYCGYSFYRRHSKTILFLAAAYLAQLVPWVFVTRTTYIYHYFPCVPFLALILTYTLKNTSIAQNRKAVIGVMAAAFVLFVLFYPVLSGMPVDYKYVEKFLELPFMKQWQLI